MPIVKVPESIQANSIDRPEESVTSTDPSRYSAGSGNAGSSGLFLSALHPKRTRATRPIVVDRLILVSPWPGIAEAIPGILIACSYPHRGGRLRFLDAETLVFSLKTHWADGTCQLLLSPQELLEKLAALVPPPRLNLVRYHGARDPQDLRHRRARTGPRSCRDPVY